MTLTKGHGPLATPGPDTVNYTVDGPGHRLLAHPFPRRVRALLGGETVLDTVRGVLLHESNLLPVLYVPLEDVSGELVPTDHTTHCPFKGGASYFTLRAGGEDRENAVWHYPEPLPGAAWLDGLVAFYWGKADAWLDEDEEVRGHLRDPFHRVDTRPSSRRVRVTAGGEVVAESTRAVVLSENGMPNRWYLPLEDVRAELRPSDKRTHCPYKGDARYLSLNGTGDVAFTYDEPFKDALAVRGLVCFIGEGIEVEAAPA